MESKYVEIVHMTPELLRMYGVKDSVERAVADPILDLEETVVIRDFRGLSEIQGDVSVK